MSFSTEFQDLYESLQDCHHARIREDKPSMTAPIIIIGMHRSGTSMISRILEELGLFMGLKKQRDHESIFFLGLNNWLIAQSGGSWDNPRPVHQLLKHTEARNLAEEHIKFIMKTPRITNYLGWKHYLSYRSVEHLDFHWGWKDPRNTFTLPLWLDLFPEAKVIHIYRNGVDVANSLFVRERARFKGRIQRTQSRLGRLFYVVRPKRGGFTDSLRCASLEGGFSLWEEYFDEARSHIRQLQARAIEIKYEDFIERPHIVLTSLTSFCGISTNEKAIAKAAEQVKSSRAYAYKNKPELNEFSQQVSSRLSIYGY